MKARILVLAIFMMISNDGFSQIGFGFRAGLHFSRFTIADLPDDFSKVKGDDYFYAGAQLEIPLSKKLSLQAEGNYALSSVQSYSPGFRDLFHDEMTHIQIPVLFKVKTGLFGFYAGPQVQFLNSAKDTYDDDIKGDSYSKFGLAAVVGAEFKFKMGLGFEVRYQYGLSDERESDGSRLTSYGKIRMNAFQTGFFFRIGGDKKEKKKETIKH